MLDVVKKEEEIFVPLEVFNVENTLEEIVQKFFDKVKGHCYGLVSSFKVIGGDPEKGVKLQVLYFEMETSDYTLHTETFNLPMQSVVKLKREEFEDYLLTKSSKEVDAVWTWRQGDISKSMKWLTVHVVFLTYKKPEQIEPAKH